MRWQPCRTGMGYLIAVVMGLAGGISRADIPGADNPKAFTEHQYRAQLAQFNHRTLVEVYKQVGHHDPRWDKPAIALLERMSLYFSQGNADAVYRDVPLPKAAEMEALGQQALAAGCDDPLVLDMYCVSLHDQGKLAQMTPLVRKAADRIVSSHYPIYRAANCIRRALQTTDARKDRQLHEKYTQMLYDAALATVKFTHFQGLDRRFVYQILASDFQAWPVEREQTFYEALVAAKADPWMTHLFGGVYHIKAAWKARGTGWASSVTPEGRRVMHEELEKARACLVQAYALQPTYPEAATNMISVVMGEGESREETLRLWFDRAVAGQFDYDYAYTSYLYAMLPRWYGTYPAMYAFGLECLKTGRYDTRVPQYLLRVLQDIRRDDEGSWLFWHRPGVMESVAGMLSRYGDLAKSPQTRRSYYSEIIGYAWQLGRYDLGRAILDKLEGHFERNGLLNAQTLPERTVSGTYAMTGSHGAALKQAEKDAAAGKWDQAIAVYEAAGKAVDPQDPQRPWLLGRAQELRWQKQFESGQWVSLTPDNQLTGWSAIAGKFQSDGRKITGTPDAFGAQLVCGCKFGRRWELTATVTVDPADPAPNATDGGLLFYWSAVRQLVGLTVSPGRQQMVYQYAATAAPYRRRVDHVSQFHVWVIDGKVEAIIGHQLAIPYRELGVPESPDSRVAIGSLLHDAVGSFQITDLKIHKLTQPPPGWGTLPPNQR